MQEFTTQRLAAKIAVRNAPGYVRTRLTLRFSLLYFTMFVAGLLLCHVTPLTSLPAIHSRIPELFCAPFSACTLAQDYIRVILHTAREDLFLLALLALSGTTYFSAAASDALLSLHALPFGLFCGGAMEAVIRGEIVIKYANLAFFAHFFSQLILAGLLLATATTAVIFCYDYRDACRDLRIRREQLAIQYLLHILSLAGSMLLTHTFRAVALWILEKI